MHSFLTSNHATFPPCYEYMRGWIPWVLVPTDGISRFHREATHQRLLRRRVRFDQQILEFQSPHPYYQSRRGSIRWSFANSMNFFELPQISLALNDEFKVFLPNLIPQMLNVLHSDRTAKRQYERISFLRYTYIPSELHRRYCVHWKCSQTIWMITCIWLSPLSFVSSIKSMLLLMYISAECKIISYSFFDYFYV